MIVVTRTLLDSRWDKEIAPYLTLCEVAAPDDLPLACAEFFHDGLLVAWEAIRRAWGKPIKVNSGARSYAKQARIRADNPKAAERSLHVPAWDFVRGKHLGKAGSNAGTLVELRIYRPCCALDLNTDSLQETLELTACVREVVPWARVFGKRYYPENSLVHVDCGPLLRFAPEAWLAPGETALPPSWLAPGLGD